MNIRWEHHQGGYGQNPGGDRSLRLERGWLLSSESPPWYKIYHFGHFPVYKFQETYCLLQEGELNSYLGTNSRTKEGGVPCLHPVWGPPCPCALSAITSSLAEEVLSLFSTYQNTRPPPGQLIEYILAGPPCLLCTYKLLWAPMLQYALLAGHLPTL